MGREGGRKGRDGIFLVSIPLALKGELLEARSAQFDKTETNKR